MDFVAALFVALVSPSFQITPGPVTVFTVVVRGVFSATLPQLATASFVLVVSVYFTGDVVCRPGDEAWPQDADEPAFDFGAKGGNFSKSFIMNHYY